MRFIQVVLKTDSSLNVEELFTPNAGEVEVMFIEDQTDPYDLRHPVQHPEMAEHVEAHS